MEVQRFLEAIMHLLLRTSLPILLSFTACIGASRNNWVPENSSTTVFPSLVVSDLEGEDHEFPQIFSERKTLILFAYRREQQNDLDPWIEGMKPLLSDLPEFRLLEMPVIETSSAMFRWYVNNGMRSGISDEEARRRTLTVYTNKKEFLAQLAIPSEELVAAILFDEQGKAIWRAEGSFSEEKRASLRGVLERTRK